LGLGLGTKFDRTTTIAVYRSAGKKITWTGVNIWHIVDGKVEEKESIYDMLDFCKQRAYRTHRKSKETLPKACLTT